VFGKLFKRNRKPVDPEARAERDRGRREAEKARHRAEAEAAKQRGFESGTSNWDSGGFPG
jgi:uncharacterized membrane protein YqiK